MSEETSVVLAQNAPSITAQQPLSIWQKFQLYKEPLVSVKCYYLKSSITSNESRQQVIGQFIMGRSHIIFQADDDSIVIVRQYSTVESIQFAPTLKISGGLTTESNYSFVFKGSKFVKKEMNEMFSSQIETLVMQSQKAAPLINENPSLDKSKHVEFLNFPFQMQVILLDLYNLANGKIPPSLAAKQPSYAAIWPNIFDETYLRYDAFKNQWMKIQIVLQSNKIYIFNSRGSSHPLCIIRITDVECEQKYINEHCEQVAVNQLVTILKKKQRKIVGMSLDGNASKQSYTKYDQGLSDFIRKCEINPITTFANIITYGNIRQVLAIDFGNDLEEDMEKLITSQYELKPVNPQLSVRLESSAPVPRDDHELSSSVNTTDRKMNASHLQDIAKQAVEEPEPSDSDEPSVYDNNFYVASESITKIIYLRDMILYAKQLADEMIVFVMRQEMGERAAKGTLLFEYSAKFSGEEKLSKGDFKLFKLVIKETDDRTRCIGSYIELTSGKTVIVYQGQQIKGAQLESIKKFTGVTQNILVSLKSGLIITASLSGCDIRDARSIVDFINKNVWEENSK